METGTGIITNWCAEYTSREVQLALKSSSSEI